MHVRFGLILWALLVVEFVLVLSGAALRYPGNDLQRQDDTTPARRQQGTLLLTSHIRPKIGEMFEFNISHFQGCPPFSRCPAMISC
jgi:hypothetical protein